MPQPGQPAASTSATPNVDIGILTMRGGEFSAVLDAFPHQAGIAVSKNRNYILRYAGIADRRQYTIAVTHLEEPGNGEAQDAARDLMDNFDPKLLLVVGIASGLLSRGYISEVRFLREALITTRLEHPESFPFTRPAAGPTARRSTR